MSLVRDAQAAVAAVPVLASARFAILRVAVRVAVDLLRKRLLSLLLVAGEAGPVECLLVGLLVGLLLHLLAHLVEVHGERVVAAGVQDRRCSVRGRRLVLTWCLRACWTGAVLAVLHTRARRVDAVVAWGLGLLLLELAGWIATAVLAEVDLEATVLLFPADGFNGLDGICDVGEVNECTGFLPEGVDQLDFAVLREILAKAVFSEGLIKVANIDIS